MIDDRIPCFSQTVPPEIVYAKCSETEEFWVPLIEKAYAKIQGNYFNLTSGQADDGLVDMSGLVSEKLSIQLRGQFNSKQLKS